MTTWNNPTLKGVKKVTAIDDHNGGGDSTELYLGIMSQGGKDTLVCVGHPGYLGHLSINGVYRGKDGKLHLSVWSITSMNEKELKKLHKEKKFSNPGNEFTTPWTIRTVKTREKLPV